MKKVNKSMRKRHKNMKKWIKNMKELNITNNNKVQNT